MFTLSQKISLGLALAALTLPPANHVQAAYHFSDFRGQPPLHQFGGAQATPSGITPEQIKNAYHLPATGGHGTIAIVDAYNDAAIEKDLNVFSAQFHLPKCTAKNKCFKSHLMGKTKHDSGWTLETALDVEWAHAIAPDAKILLVEAQTPSGHNLLRAVDYARAQPGVVAISMSWGGAEFPDEVSLDSHFTSPDNTIAFFASSGDNGAGASWPASSPNVIAVGGTSLRVAQNGDVQSETSWDGSGGGISAYESEPSYQQDYGIMRARGARAIPDVAYHADPQYGFPVYRSGGATNHEWYTVGGTSAGAPQWAAIQALGLSATNTRFYADKSSTNHDAFFRDIRSGANGDCGYYCTARRRYDYVTGLGSPLTVNF